MGQTFIASPGDSVKLSLTVEDGVTNVFPLARVYDATDAQIATVSLAHVAFGRYGASYTVPGTAQIYKVLYTVYTDAGHTTLDTTHGSDEDYLVTDLKSVWKVPTTSASTAGSMGEALQIIMAVAAKSNFRIDNMVYDVNGFMTNARIRVFPNSTVAAASTEGGSAEGETTTITMTGIVDGVFNSLPKTVLGLKP